MANLFAKSKKKVVANGRLTLFIMTDLKRDKWNGTFLSRLGEGGWDVKTGDVMAAEAADAGKRTVLKEYGLLANRVDRRSAGKLLPVLDASSNTQRVMSQLEAPTDVSLFVEQAICSCATLGFVGTRKSTASGHVNNMRTANICHERWDAHAGD